MSVTEPSDIFISVVIPAYNEEATIKDVVKQHAEILQNFKSTPIRWEIVCLDDGSSDGTYQAIACTQEEIRNLRILRHVKNEGIAPSFKKLYESAAGTHIYATGADNQWPAKNLAVMLKHLIDAQVDLVVGVRSNRSKLYTPWRRFVSILFNEIPRILFKVETKDAGSVKLGIREIYAFPIVSKGPFSEAERIISAFDKGYRVDFVPIEFMTRVHGRSNGVKISNLLVSIRDCLICFIEYRVKKLLEL